MKALALTIQKRDQVGRKVKNLRRDGFLPATIYGKKIKSTSVTVSQESFISIYKKAGETGLVELTIEGENKETRPVLIHTVQVDPVTGHALHVEFHQVDLKEKVHANVPLELTGEAPAVINKVGVLISVLDEVEVEALPTDLPDKILIDTSGLSDVGQEIKVSDLKAPSGVTILSDANLTVVNVGSLVSKEAEEQAASEAAAAAAAAVPEEGAPVTEAPTATPVEVAPKTPEEKKE